MSAITTIKTQINTIKHQIKYTISLINQGVKSYILRLLDLEEQLEILTNKLTIINNTFKKGAEYIDYLYREAIASKNFKLQTVAYGIAFADQTGRLPGELSLKLRNPAFVQECVVSLMDAAIVTIDDVAVWLRTRFLPTPVAAVAPVETVEETVEEQQVITCTSYLVGIQKPEITHRTAWAKYAVATVTELNGAIFSVSINAEDMFDGSLDIYYQELKKAVIGLHSEKATGCEMTSVGDTFKITKM